MRLAEQLRTTTFLLTLRYMVLFFVSITILLGFVNWSTMRYLERETDLEIEADLRGLAELGRQTTPEAIAQVLAARIRTDPAGDAIYLLTDRQFRPLVGNMATWPPLENIGDGWVQFELDDGTPVRARLHEPRQDLWLLVGRRMPGIDRLTRLFETTTFWGLGITLALALGGGLFMSADVIRRVQAINETSRRIMEGDLSQRISTRGTRDEFDELAVNLNAMLDRIESLMTSIQHMSDNVAHDLRTPLTRLRNRLEGLRRTATPEETEEIEACLEDADGLLSTFASLLSIARIESGTTGSDEGVELSRLVRDACELYQAVAEEKNVDLQSEIGDGLETRGDRNLIFQALANLLDNAIKYTPAGGEVCLSLAAADGGVELVIGDSGPGIPADLRDRVLDPFYRLDQSRSQPGSGLGLSLVRAIAQRHGAELVLEDNSPGLRVRLRFPPSKSPPATMKT